LSLEQSAFAFLDETGSLPTARDRFFAVGLLKCPEPAHIQRPMQLLRDRRQFRSEIKWTDTSGWNLDIYKEAVDCFVGCPKARFACFIADKQSADPIARFGDQWKAYERLAAQLIVGNIGKTECVAILADELSTPHNVTFEETLRGLIDTRLKRRAVVGVCRMRSTGVDVFQILDLLLGSVAYEYKQSVGLVPAGVATPKAKLLEYIKAELKVTTFVGGIRNARVNVAQQTAKTLPAIVDAAPKASPSVVSCRSRSGSGSPGL